MIRQGKAHCGWNGFHFWINTIKREEFAHNVRKKLKRERETELKVKLKEGVRESLAGSFICKPFPSKK